MPATVASLKNASRRPAATARVAAVTGSSDPLVSERRTCPLDLEELHVPGGAAERRGGQHEPVDESDSRAAGERTQQVCFRGGPPGANRTIASIVDRFLVRDAAPRFAQGETFPAATAAARGVDAEPRRRRPKPIGANAPGGSLPSRFSLASSAALSSRS